MPQQRITLVSLGVADLDRACAFYAALGWSPTVKADGMACYQLQGQALMLFGRAALAEDQGRAEAELGTGAMTLAQNYTTRDDVDAAYAHAIEAGARALTAPEPVFWGGYSGYFADPDGHVWEVAHNPCWPLAADGSLTLPEAP
ncbi:MAG: VOC family protein [Rhodobacteraceae bacterium]|nr:VOC family protein [Paracoccaceae bacterium]